MDNNDCSEAMQKNIHFRFRIYVEEFQMCIIHIYTESSILSSHKDVATMFVPQSENGAQKNATITNSVDRCTKITRTDISKHLRRKLMTDSVRGLCSMGDDFT